MMWRPGGGGRGESKLPLLSLDNMSNINTSAIRWEIKRKKMFQNCLKIKARKKFNRKGRFRHYCLTVQN